MRLSRMSQEESKENSNWSEFELSPFLMSETVKALHTGIDREWDHIQRSACQTAAGRALWNHMIHDPVADVLAGENYLRSLYEKMQKDRTNKAREVSGVILAVRTLWFDSKIKAALELFDGDETQVVILGAGMDARAYRLGCLKDSNVFEVDFPMLLQTKSTLLQAVTSDMREEDSTRPPIMMLAKSLVRVAADVRERNWIEKLETNGFESTKKTVWVLEGLLYYLPDLDAMQVLRCIAAKCAITPTILLADFMNKSSTTLADPSVFHFASDWPDHLLPPLGFSSVKLSQIGDPDADFGLMKDPLNLFNRIRNLPRSVDTHPEDGSPCHRLYLVQASGSPSDYKSLRPNSPPNNIQL